MVISTKYPPLWRGAALNRKDETMGLTIREPKTTIKLYIEPIELDCDIHHLAKKFRDTADFLDRLESANTERKVPEVLPDGREKLCVELPWEAEPLRMSIYKEWENKNGEIDNYTSAYLFGTVTVCHGDTNIELLEDVNIEDYEKLTVAEAIDKEIEKTIQQMQEWFTTEEE